MDAAKPSQLPEKSLQGCRYCSRCGKVFERADNMKLCPHDSMRLVPVTDPFEGTDIGRDFRLLELLGLGGWGVVYKALQVRLNRVVALKMLHRGLSVDAEISGRFKREAELASRLHHANIAELIDYGILPTGEPFMIMEYLEGVDLGKLLEERVRLSFEEAYPIVRQLCDALSAAHAQNIIHRDIKASNVRIIDFGKKDVRVKLLDFGLACWSADSLRNVSKLTSTGATIGTPSYMSPEQCRGSIVDVRSDIYSLGCVMYEMLTGSLPFVAPNAFEVMHGHMYREPPSFESHEVLVPPAVQETIFKAMAKDPAQRYQSAAEFKRALDECNAGMITMPAVVRGLMQHFSPLALITAALAWFGTVSVSFLAFPPRLKNLPSCFSIVCGGITVLLNRFFISVANRNPALFTTCTCELVRAAGILAGKYMHESQDFQLVSLLEGCADLLNKKAMKRNISLSVYVSPEIRGALRGDSEQLRYVLLELVDYLLDCATGVEVTIEALPGAVQGDRITVCFRLTITGQSVDESALWAFFRARETDTSTVLPASAAGLGLAPVQAAIGYLGGRFFLERRARNSSLLMFTLPFCLASKDTDDTGLVEQLSGKRLLLAGVPANVAETITGYAKSWGVDCDAVTMGTAAEAIKRATARQSPFHAVIIQDGADDGAFDLAAAVSSQPVLSDTQLILLTGRNDSQEKALRSGFSGILSQPVKMRRLQECISRAVTAQAPAPPPASALPEAQTAANDRPLALLIDPNQEERRMVLIQLRILGIDAHAVNTADEAADGIAAGRYGMIMVDCSTADGFHMARAARKLEPGPTARLPIVALVPGGNQDEQQLFCTAAGINHCLEKPISPQHLKKLVTSLMLADEDETAMVWKAEDTILPNQGFDETAPLYAPDADPIDLSALNETFGQHTAGELLNVFVMTAEGLLDHIDRAMKRGHVRSLELLAHQLKGSSGAIGAGEVARLAVRLEESARRSDFAEALIVFEAAKFAVSKTRKFIEKQVPLATAKG